jgi:hypothetical protein
LVVVASEKRVNAMPDMWRSTAQGMPALTYAYTSLRRKTSSKEVVAWPRSWGPAEPSARALKICSISLDSRSLLRKSGRKAPLTSVESWAQGTLRRHAPVSWLRMLRIGGGHCAVPAASVVMAKSCGLASRSKSQGSCALFRGRGASMVALGT